MLHWSPKLVDDCSDTEDCDSFNNFESSSSTIFDHQLDSAWMSGKRRPVLYIPSLQSDQEIYGYMLEDIAMPSVSFSEEQEFEKTVQLTDHNSNNLTESAEAVTMETGEMEEKHIAISVPICALDPKAPVRTKRQRCDNFPFKGKNDAFPLELNRHKPGSCDHELVICSSSGSTVDSTTTSTDINDSSLDDIGDFSRPSVSPTDRFSNKENRNVTEDPSESEDPYDMHNLRDSLPKLKVTTPAHLHNEISGAFMSYSEMEASNSAWQTSTSHDIPDTGGTSAGEVEHDTSFCSVDSTMTTSSVESLPKVFYDPELHRDHHLTAVSVPPLRRGFALAAANCDRTVMSSGASYDSARSQMCEPKTETKSCLRNGMFGLSSTSRLRTPETNPSYATSFTTSSKSRFSRRPEPTLSKAMVKLVFPSPSKSSSLNGFVVENQRTNDFMELYSKTCGKRIRSLKAASPAEDLLDSKRRCQRSTTPQFINLKTEPHSEPTNNENFAKNDELRTRMSCAQGATVPRQQTSSVPRDHRLGISGATPMRSRMSVKSSSSVPGHSFARRPSHRRSLFSLEPKRHALSSCDNSRSISENGTVSGPSDDGLTSESVGSGDLESDCRAKKRPLLDQPGKVDSKRALTLSSPLGKRNPLLQKFFDNIPVVTATNVMQYSDDQMEAVTLKNTLLNRGQSGKLSKATVTTHQSSYDRPPSRLKWRAELVTIVTENSKLPVTTATAKARKSILSVRSRDIKTS